jgi:hypothetical protein
MSADSLEHFARTYSSEEVEHEAQARGDERGAHLRALANLLAQQLAEGSPNDFIINSTLMLQGCLLICAGVGVGWAPDGQPHLISSAGIGLQASISLSAAPTLGQRNWFTSASTSLERIAGILSGGIARGIGTGPVQGGIYSCLPGVVVGEAEVCKVLTCGLELRKAMSEGLIRE